MPYQQYQRYRMNRRTSSRRRWWFIGAGIVLILLVWWRVSAQPATEENTNDTANTNITSDANTNTTEASTFTTVAYDLDRCTQPISIADEQPNGVVLTFNSVRTAGSTEQILSTLASKNVKADFFVTGVWVEANPDLAKQIAESGHGLYSLGYEYVNYATKSAADIQSDFEKVDTLFTEAVGRTGQPFFRPPFGATDDDLLNTVKQYGYCPVIWTFDSLDWSADYTSEEIRNRILEKATAGSVLVMQTSNSVVPEILGSVIDGLTAKGLTIRPLAEQLVVANQ